MPRRMIHSTESGRPDPVSLLSLFLVFLFAAGPGYLYSQPIRPGFVEPIRGPLPAAEPSSILSVGLMSQVIAPFADVSLLSRGATFRANPGGLLGLSYGGWPELVFTVPKLPFIQLKAGAGLVSFPLADLPGFSFLYVHGFIGPGLSLRIGERISLGVHTMAGGYILGGAFYEGLEAHYIAPSPYWSWRWSTNHFDLSLLVGAGASFHLSDRLSLNLGLSYIDCRLLTSGICVSAGASYHLPRLKKLSDQIQEMIGPQLRPLGDLEASDFQLRPVYPVFYGWYDDNSLGGFVLHNRGTTAIEKLTVTLFEGQYMNHPKAAKTAARLDPGQSTEVELYGLFTDSILSVSEGTKVAAKITVDCESAGLPYRNEYVQTMEIYNRNALSWDDDRKAAAFVTAKDTDILNLTKNVISISAPLRRGSLNMNFVTALSVHETLGHYGISYVIDPASPYEAFSKEASAVDFLQFPRQTLHYRAGDCDDLSVLYCAMLESVGIPTAFITCPGHIYIAVDLGMTKEEAGALFSSLDDLIVRDGSAWLPLEITLAGSGFLQAWKEGARQWRRWEPQDLAGFFPVRSAWGVYRPVGFQEASGLRPLDEVEVAGRIEKELKAFAMRELQPRIDALTKELAQARRPELILNTIGIAYARYGVYDSARDAFGKSAETGYLPAITNLGNLHYLQGNYIDALALYEKAYAKDRRSAIVVLALARTHHELENYGFVTRLYDELRRLDSSLASQYEYLALRGEAADRAASASGMPGRVEWEVEHDQER